MSKAQLIVRFRDVPRADELIEMVIWRLPKPAAPSTHPFKYRLAWIVEGRRVVGFDNERGKGDHRHVGDSEFQYEFKDANKLIDDFRMAVEKWNAP
ncbi:MAG: hypothetical protein FJY34_12810 [Betaproteobacteria bacterium]|nr:hypothetical protein [Betaproteobacteria bacterium]